MTYKKQRRNPGEPTLPRPSKIKSSKMTIELAQAARLKGPTARSILAWGKAPGTGEGTICGLKARAKGLGESA